MCRYISIDIETTGLDPEYCQIIEFAAIADDLTEQLPLNELKTFQTYVLYDRYVGEPYALSLNEKIFRTIANREKFPCSLVTPDRLLPEFYNWLLKIGYVPEKNDGIIKINAAGKNFASFDNAFLNKLPKFPYVYINHRTLDPSILYFNPKTDKRLPSTEECMARAGIHGVVKHEALDDAMTVVKLLRKKFPGV